MDKKNFVLFKLYKDNDGKYHGEEKEGRVAVEFRVVKPNRQVGKDADIEYQKEFQKLLKTDAFILKAQTGDLLKKQGVWSDEQEAECKRQERKLSEALSAFCRGGMTKSEGYDKAVEIIKIRQKLNGEYAKQNSLDPQTAENRCEDTRINYMIYKCTQYNKDGKLVFGHLSFEQYMQTDDEALNVVMLYAGNKLLELLLDVNLGDNKQAEWKFLEKYGYTDEEGRLLDKTKTHLVNLDGERINEKGQHVNENGEVVDRFGNVQLDIDDAEFTD